MAKSLFFGLGWMSLTVSVSFTATASGNEDNQLNLLETSQVVSRFGDTVVGGYEKVNANGQVVQTIDSVSIMIADKSEVAALSKELTAETLILKATLQNKSANLYREPGTSSISKNDHQ